MYTEFFGLNEKPFSITPDPRYLYLTDRHADALAHLVYGISEAGGFIQLTGEVGTGKTTLIRSLLDQMPSGAKIAVVLNPNLTVREFLASICVELGIPTRQHESKAALISALNHFLLNAHAESTRVVLIVDEAQTLGADLLEQVRLLTNLETARQKLLQIILIGQPELRELLNRPDMRQVAQRITGRFHLEPLNRREVAAYVSHRMRVAGSHGEVFTGSAMRELYRRSGGIPRLVNVIADRALLAGFTLDSHRIDARIVRRAATEVFGLPARRWWPYPALAAMLAIGALLLLRPWIALEPPATGANMALAVAPAAAPTSAAANPSDDAAETAEPTALVDAVTAPPADPTSTTAGADELPAPAPSGAASTAPLDPAPLVADSASHPAENQELGWLDGALADPDGWDNEAAYRELVAAHGATADAAGEPACAQARAQQFDCLLVVDATPETLLTIGEPLVVRLSGPDERTLDAALMSLDAKAARLIVAGREIVVPYTTLETAWNGEFVELWRPGMPSTDTLRLGTGRDEDIFWLRRALASVYGRPLSARAATRPFDSELERLVLEYQRDRELIVDGIVGAATREALLEDLGLTQATTASRSD